MAELLDRARLLLAAGPYGANTAEIAAVHAAIYPDREAVCQNCRGELGRALGLGTSSRPSPGPG